MQEQIMSWMIDNMAGMLHLMKIKLSGELTPILLEPGWLEFMDHTRELNDTFTANKIGAKIYLNGWVQNTIVGNNTICILPVSFRPTTSKEIMCYTDNGVDTITIRANGQVTYNNNSDGIVINLTSVYFDLR